MVKASRPAVLPVVRTGRFSGDTRLSDDQETVTRLLADLERGDQAALDELFALIYDELKELARRQRHRWRGDYTLNTTALVHEAYVRLLGQRRVRAESRAHFRSLAARAMRHILCNYARDRGALKRGGGVTVVALGPDGEASPDEIPDVDQRWRLLETLVTLDDALRRLEEVDPRGSRIVECRFFGGMTTEETAVALEISPRTVKRGWVIAQAWLHREMESPG